MVLHLLAHLPVAGPENLHDASYVAWVQRVAPAAHRERLAEAVHRLRPLAAREGLLAAQALVVRWPSLDSLHGAASESSSAELGSVLVAALRQIASSFEGLYQAHVAPKLGEALRADLDCWRAAQAVRPDLDPSAVERSWVLGGRGRVIGERIIVGVADAPGSAGADRWQPVVVALHERSVRAAVARDYVGAEWEALVGLSRAIAAGPAELRVAHRKWLARLDLRPLCTALVEGGTLSSDVAERLVAHRDVRATQLAGL